MIPDSDWYDEWHRKNGVHAWRPLQSYSIYADEIPDEVLKSGVAILDIGCGVGHLAGLLKSRGAHSVTGVDFSTEAIKLAWTSYPEVRWYCAPAASTGLATSSADFIFCLGALEHFPDITAALWEMVRVAKSGAQLFILVPNRWFVGRLLMTRGGTPQVEVREVYKGLRGWTKLFKGCGLRVVSVKKDNWPACRMSGLYRTVWNALPLRLSYTFLFRLELDV